MTTINGDALAACVHMDRIYVFYDHYHGSRTIYCKYYDGAGSDWILPDNDRHDTQGKDIGEKNPGSIVADNVQYGDQIQLSAQSINGSLYLFVGHNGAARGVDVYQLSGATDVGRSFSQKWNFNFAKGVIPDDDVLSSQWQIQRMGSANFLAIENDIAKTKTLIPMALRCMTKDLEQNLGPFRLRLQSRGG